MKGSLYILACFIAGIFIGYNQWLMDFYSDNWMTYALYLLIFSVGLGIGLDGNIWKQVKSQKGIYLLLPLGTMAGTFAGISLIAWGINAFSNPSIPQWSYSDCLAVGAGFGYYSLSSVLITASKGAALGSIALMSNIIREIFTMVAAPLLSKYTGKLSVISTGGATSMDSTLPFISLYSGSEFVPLSIYHGFIVDFSVPFWVSLFCSF